MRATAIKLLSSLLPTHLNLNVKIIAFAPIFLAAFVNFSAQARPAESEKPYQMMQKLSPLTGNWIMSRERTFDGGTTWEKYPSNLINIRYRHNDLLLEEGPTGCEKAAFDMSILISFDQYQNVYRQAAIENYWGLMDISEGHVENDKLIFTNTESKTYYPMENDRLRALKVSMELTSPSRTTYIEESYDDGKTWSPSFRIRYERLTDTHSNLNTDCINE